MDNVEEFNIVVENEEALDVSAKLENDFLRGEKGQKGDSNILTIGTVEKGEEAFAEIIGESPNQVLNLVLPKGDIGSRGLQGEQGIQGEKGEKGDTGPQGLQGEKGKKGDVGPQGLQGEKGDKGDVGPKGEKGDTGDTGPQGMQGPKGEKGDTGPRGLQGEKGEKGDPGNGVPLGGAEGQVLTKKSEVDGDVEWKDNAGGDTLPIGSIVEYEGNTVPEGYEEVEKEKVVLYDNTEGSNEDIVLSDDAENYNRLKIYYFSNDGVRNSVEIDSRKILNFTLSAITPFADSIYWKYTRYAITKTNMKILRYGEATLNGLTTFSNTSNNIFITKVVGYKEG